MGAAKRKCKISLLQLLLVFTIGILYVRLICGVFRLHSSRECQAAKDEDVILQDSLLGCSAELFQRKELATVAQVNGEIEKAYTVDDWRKSLGECTASDPDLKQFVKYDLHSDCPDDWPTVEDLIWKENCQSLPRRKCFAAMPETYSEPYSFSEALWRTPDKDNVRWDHYECKSFECLTSRKGGEVFQLEKEKGRWHHGRHVGRQTVFDVQTVLALKEGSIRIGLDIGGGAGFFAAQMAAHNVTVVTTSMNEGVPLLETLALRGLIGLQLSSKARLPFFDNSMDILHSRRSVNSLSPEEFESVLFDWDRVLRPGGILWIQEFQQRGYVLEDYLTRIQLLGYTVHQWISEIIKEKDRRMNQLTLVLEKPLQRISMTV